MASVSPAAIIETDEEHVTIHPRAYQIEMLQESLKGNIIATMDTGSGKTHVAVLRIKKELEFAPVGKLIWFLTPTVSLCLQQLDVLRVQIPSAQIKSFTSHDRVDRWTEKSVWDAVLTNVKIAVSTYAVLYDALCHAFVGMESLALVVFDEAHNCIRKHPGSKLMQNFYWPRKNANETVPHILGLTASPVMSSKLDDLETLESILDATCKSPHKQKMDLSLHVNRPIMVQIPFTTSEHTAKNPNAACTMASLIAVYTNLNIHDDPEIIRLRTTNTDASKRKLERALMGKKTFIQTQMRSFVRTSGQINLCLGTWAADTYVSQVTTGFIQSTDSKDARFLEWEDAEKQYLANALRRLHSSAHTIPAPSEDQSISDKARVIIQFLGSCHKDTVGIIFVKERATAHMLHRLLLEHPDTRDRFCLGTTVGTSKRPVGKRDIFDFAHHEIQYNALTKFRCGEVNLLIATSVVEEGIDVPQCNLVICFDEPDNLKSFVQRRGRARLRESKLVMLLDRSSQNRISEWEGLEREMKQRYEMEERAVRKLAKLEEDERAHHQRYTFRVPTTGALLEMDSAKGHLECFCSRLSSHSHLRMRPEYMVIEERYEDGNNEPPELRAMVTLPVTLDTILRTHKSQTLWKSEKNATKDAAFQAYLALYNAGLINDHLLPLTFTETSKHMDRQDSIIEVHEQFDPWSEVARAWEKKEKIQQRVLTMKDELGLTKCQIVMLIPAKVPDMKEIQLHWDVTSQLEIEIGSATTIPHSALTNDDTAALLSHSYGHRWQVEKSGHIALFKAMDVEISSLPQESLLSIPQERIDDPVSLLRDQQNHGHPYLFDKWLSTKPLQQKIRKPHKDYQSFPSDQPFVALKKWPIRSDFLHPVQGSPTDRPKEEYFTVIPRSMLRIDPFPMELSQFGLLIPSLLHKVQIQLVAAKLCATVLPEVEILDFELIRTAISAPVAQEQDHYQTLEFLGDSVLKFFISTFVASKNPNWPEGYLSAMKDTIVSNSRLCKAGLDRGLDKFILTKIFTGRKWRPIHIKPLLEEREEGTRKIPSKMVADVVESLIGAGWKMGHCHTSLSIVKVFLPEVDLPSLEVGRSRLFDLAVTDVPLPADLHHLETLAGYSFKKKSLLAQSMSHCSDVAATASYERLEFLGDAVLEIIIVTELMEYEGELSHSLMHLYKTALVNADYLSFIALDWKITQAKLDLKEDPVSGLFIEAESQFSLPLWRFMRHGIFGIGETQCEVERRYASLRCDILQVMEHGMEYPWTLLAKIHANKFYSDLVESLLAAVWVDSGSLDACKGLLDRMGVLKFMHRLVKDRVHALHPREELCILAGDKEVKYNVEVQKSNGTGNIWTCTVSVGQSQFIEVVSEVSDDEVRTRSAEEAVALLRFANGRSGSPVAYGK